MNHRKKKKNNNTSSSAFFSLLRLPQAKKKTKSKRDSLSTKIPRKCRNTEVRAWVSVLGWKEKETKKKMNGDADK